MARCAAFHARCVLSLSRRWYCMVARAAAARDQHSVLDMHKAANRADGHTEKVRACWHLGGGGAFRHHRSQLDCPFRRCSSFSQCGVVRVAICAVVLSLTVLGRSTLNHGACLPSTTATPLPPSSPRPVRGVVHTEMRRIGTHYANWCNGTTAAHPSSGCL